MDLADLEKNVRGFIAPEYGRVPRDGFSYMATRRFISRGIRACLMMHRRLERLDQTARLLRDTLDFLLRRYHGYAIEEQIQAHYRDKSLLPGDRVDFEHVIPMANLIALLIQGKISIALAMNPPTCLVSKKHHVQLGVLGMTDSTPDIWWFWKRYRDLGIELETHRGDPVDLETWNLGTHISYFNIDL